MDFPPTITEAAAAIRDGKLTSVELVIQCLERIDRYEDKIHAWVLVDRDGAIDSAIAADYERAGGNDRGPLHGIPIGIKDIIDVKGMPTRCGSSLTSSDPTKKDATVVARLSEAGAIILGKTVTCEWACFDPSPTRNPWNLDRSPGGSSSGSAAAVAAGMCLGAIGTQTGGSVIRPAAFCGVCGFKPGYGLLSMEGVQAFSSTLDHIGVFARSAHDTFHILSSMVPKIPLRWREIEFMASSPSLVPRPDPLKRHSFLVVDSPTQFVERTCHPGVFQVFQNAVARLRDSITHVENATASLSFEDAIDNHRTIMCFEAAATHAFRLADRESLGPKFRVVLEDGLNVTKGNLLRAQAGRMEMTREAERITKEYDALLMPAVGTTSPGLDSTGDSRFQAIWSLAGLPTITIPCGLSADGLPIGMQLIGRRNSEKALCHVAGWCEAVIRFDDRPRVD